MDQLKPSAPNSCPLTPLTFLERATIVHGDRTSLVHGPTVFTWSETCSRCLRAASSLAALGLGKAAVVSVVAPNIPAMYELQFAIPMAGFILHNINIRLDSRTVSAQLLHAGSRAVIVDSRFRSLVLCAFSLLPISPLLILIEDEEDNGGGESGDGDFSHTYEAMVRGGDHRFEWVRPENEWTPMTLNYTSGTTSSPKGAVHSHRSIYLMALDSLINWRVPTEPVYLWTLPMFHSNGWSYTWAMAAAGATNVCLRRFDAAEIYAAIRTHGVTHMCGAPVVLNMLVNYPGAERLESTVEFLTGGAPPPPSVILLTESLGFRISHGYGLTEVAGVVVSCAWRSRWDSLRAGERARLKARQGVRTLGLTEADVVDPTTGESVRRDGATMGEIVVRGGSLMLGYLKNPEATAKCMRNGWLFTGDVGVMHPDGYMEIKDRAKDIIISGGENVSSVEVEAVLYEHPAVKEVAVVARPDEFWGETPCAFVSVKEGGGRSLTEGEVVEFCRGRLPRFMVPRTVVLIAELPKTATGKVQKFTLREIARKMGAAPAASRL